MQETKETIKLLEIINQAILNKKGEHLININFGKIDDSVCTYFVICHANSDVHVNSIAEEVIKDVKEKHNETAYSKEGLKTSNWILIDYLDIVVHIFQEEYRNFYNLEDLWADAEIKKVD